MTIPTPIAFSPGSVTGFFVPKIGATPETTSSPGCGICISDGVTAAVRPAPSNLIRFNGREIALPPVRSVIEALAPEPVEVFLETNVPLGCGFGISAASSLTTAFALARHFGLEKSRQELGTIVLHAEIRARTGIGDPITQLTGGVVLRRWRTGPFDCESLTLAEGGQSSLYYRVFGPLSTKAVLSDPALVRRLADEGRQAMAWIEQERSITLSAILDHTLVFAEGAGLVTDERVIHAVRAVQDAGGKATMVMLGQSVLADRLPPGDSEGWRECRVDPQGTRYLS